MILPYDVPANEFMNAGGSKASKSAGVGTTVPQLLTRVRSGRDSLLPDRQRARIG